LNQTTLRTEKEEKDYEDKMSDSPRDKGKEKIEESSSADSIAKEKNTLKVSGQAHAFYKKHYVGPVYCNLCKESIWGMGKACYACEGD